MLPSSSTGLIPFAGDVNHNVGVLSKAIYAQPEKTKGRIVTAVAETISVTQWAANLDKVAKRKDPNTSVTFVSCTLNDFQRVWGIRGLEVGWMIQYFDDDEGRGWSYTKDGQAVLTAADLGVADQLRSEQDVLEWF